MTNLKDSVYTNLSTTILSDRRMAHLINVVKEPEELRMEMDEPEDAQFAVISHSRALVSPNEKEFDLIQKKLEKLMEDGRGETIFEVGIGTDPNASDEDGAEDAGLKTMDYDASVATLQSIAMSLDSDCVLLRERILSGGINNSTEIPPDARRTGQYLLRKKADMKVR